jgi:hypothetical protein
MVFYSYDTLLTFSPTKYKFPPKAENIQTTIKSKTLDQIKVYYSFSCVWSELSSKSEK